MLPILFRDASTSRKPRKGASLQLVEIYREEMKQRNINALAFQSLQQLQRERAAGEVP